MTLRRIFLILLVLTAAVSCGRRQSAPPIPAHLVQLCGDPGLAGVVLPAIKVSGSACGISRPVEVHFVSGVALNEKPILNCDTARTLREWVDRGAQPAVRSLQARITSLRVVSHYACRTRNSQRGGKISEHAKGNAIDIAGFTLDNGERVSVLEDWRSNKYGPALRGMYSAACGRFSTTLGPNSDRFHQDHMHFDTANYRGGTYCR